MPTYEVKVNDETFLVDVPALPDESSRISIDGSSITVEWSVTPAVGRPFNIQIDRVVHTVLISSFEGDRFVRMTVDEHAVEAEVKLVTMPGGLIEHREAPPPGARVAMEEMTVNSPLPGRIASIRVGVGEHVDLGSPLLMIEAMKMENEIASPKKGIVAEIHVSQDMDVKRGDPLITIR